VADSDTSVDEAELAALKAELDARKTLIKSLRADAERVAALETQLEGKREAVASLETSINQHVETIAELKRGLAAWKKKYQAAKGELFDTAAVSTHSPTFTDTELEALKELERTNAPPDHTVAIDMRDALKEARRKRQRAES
jgi:chromosome segregation ATPase